MPTMIVMKKIIGIALYVVVALVLAAGAERRTGPSHPHPTIHVRR